MGSAVKGSKLHGSSECLGSALESRKIRQDAGHRQRFREILQTGVISGTLFGLVLVVVESTVIRAWWSGNVIAPHELAQTRMFDFMVEGYSWSRQWVNTAALPPTLTSVYGPGWLSFFHLSKDLALVVLPVAALLGLFVAWGTAAAGKYANPRTTIRNLVLLGLCWEIAGWFASVHPPLHYSLALLARLALRNFVWDGVLASCLILVATGGMALATAPVLLPQQIKGSRPRSGFGILLIAAGIWTISAASAGVPTGHASYRPAVTATQPLDTKVPKPNILLISIDSLRADRLGCYGHDRNTSPRIDALAHSGAMFVNAWSTTSWTLPAHVSLLSGRSLLGHGVDRARKIPQSVPTLAEILKRQGYTTAAFVSAPWLSSRFGFGRGFDLYDDFSVPFTPDRESRMRAQATVSAPLLAPSIERWLRDKAKPPFFLFLHYFDVHYDYQPPAPYDTMFDSDHTGPISGRRFHADSRIRPGMPARDLQHLLALYDGEIRFTDTYIGKVLDLMRDLGLSDRTLIILTADHGDEFLEHGGKGHHRTLYEEVLRVPLIISWPGHLPAGLKISEPVSIIDIAPTVLAALGVPALTGMEGVSLVPKMTGSGGIPPRALVSELYVKEKLNLQVAVREGSEKLIQSLNFPKREVYDLTNDPGEKNPRRRSAGVRLEQDLASWMSRTWGHRKSLGSDQGKVTLDKGRMDALRALGYVE